MNIFTVIGLAATFAVCLIAILWAAGLLEMGFEDVEDDESDGSKFEGRPGAL